MMPIVYSSFLSDEKINICFHKSCVDGLFSVIILLACLEKEHSIYENYNFIPLSPTEINRQTGLINDLQDKKKIILDLPFFGTNVRYYFDHHITNQNKIPKSNNSGLLDISAASTCSVLKTYFQIPDNHELQFLIKIADIIDQAHFSSPPPNVGKLILKTFNDIVWACNDLIKDIRDEKTLIELLETFEIKNLVGWITKHQDHLMNYRKRRQQTLKIKSKLTVAPIIIIKNESLNLQAEGLHFSLVAENPNYKMLILINKTKKFGKKAQQYKVSFRLNPKLSHEDSEVLRVDNIASELGGGGHKGAASATLNDLGTDYSKIIDWLLTLGLNYSEHQF